MIITQTPLRVSFAGGGTDVPEYFERHGGYVISTAIDKLVYCIVKKRFDDKIYVNWSKKEIVDSVVEMSFLSDIRGEGSGLGSPSTVTVGVLNALPHYAGNTPTTEQLAREACEIEIETLGRRPLDATASPARSDRGQTRDVVHPGAAARSASVRSRALMRTSPGTEPSPRMMLEG